MFRRDCRNFRCMRRLGTMLPLSKRRRSPAWIVVLILLVAGCGVAGAAQDSGGAHSQNPPAVLNGGVSGEADKGVEGGFVFKAEVQEVTLQATVVDDHRRPVTTLDRSAFQVFEDGKPQRIISFRREDIPVALGVVIDNSGSMREKR